MARQYLGVAPSRATDLTQLSTVTSRIVATPLGSWTAVQTSDLSSTTGAAIDTSMMATLPIGTYVIDAYILAQTPTANQGPRYAIGNGSTTLPTTLGTLEVNTSLTASTATLITASDTLYGTVLPTASTTFPARIHAMFTVTTANLKVGIRFGSSTTSSNMILKAGSYATISLVGTQANVAGAAQRILTKRDITASYTLVAADAQDVVLNSTSASALTITLPVNGVVPIESSISWRQTGAGQITFAAASGMTLVSRGSVYKSAGQYAGGVVTQISSTQWLLEGDIVS